MTTKEDAMNVFVHTVTRSLIDDIKQKRKAYQQVLVTSFGEEAKEWLDALDEKIFDELKNYPWKNE